METTEKAYKPKMRVQLLSEHGMVESDRLVDQTIEMSTGPKLSHTGIIRLEVVLASSLDIDACIQYIRKLSGGLPIKEVAKQGRKSGPDKELASPRESIFEDVKNMASDETNNQDDIIKYLRGLGFVFLLTEDFLTYFPQFEFKSRDIGEATDNGQYLDSYQWMVPRIKTGKDPKTDKYDPMIIFGFNILGERSPKFVSYIYKERMKPLKSAIPSKNAISFNNTELTKFPKYMLEEERLKFSTEMRQLIVNKSKKPSKFFLRWFQDVTFPDTLKESMQEAYSR